MVDKIPDDLNGPYQPQRGGGWISGPCNSPAARPDERGTFSARQLVTEVLTLLDGRGIRTRINSQTALIAAVDLLRALDVVATDVVEGR